MTEWHLITSEYPPQFGGVSDYSHITASGLAAAGDAVHVWCPPAEGETPRAAGVTVHRELGSLTPKDLRRVGHMLDRHTAPRRLLVQWVPHGFGYRSMNLPFCLWLWHRATRKRDEIDLMVHEPFLMFGEGSWRQDAVAVVHRVMTTFLLRSARRLWFAIPAWERHLRPFALGRAIPSNWLPACSCIPIVDDPVGVNAIRNQYARSGDLLIGHFGTYERLILRLLMASAPDLLRDQSKARLLLLGRGSEAARRQLLLQYPDLEPRVHAAGALPAADLSLHVSACDLMLQPYPDGISSRRTSAMVGLSHGRPILTTSGRLTESLWKESDAVLLSPVEDATALTELARRVLMNEGERKRLGSAAQGLYQKRFDYRHMISALRG